MADWERHIFHTSPRVTRHGPRALAEWERHIFHTRPASRPKSRGRLGAAHLPHKPGVTAQQSWQSGSGTSSTQARRHGPRALADWERRIFHASPGVTAQEACSSKAFTARDPYCSGTCSTKVRASRAKSPGRLGASHLPCKPRRHGPRGLFQQSFHGPRPLLQRHMFHRRSGVTAQESWQTWSGASCTKAWASRLESPGRLGAAHLPRKPRHHGLKYGTHYNIFHQTAGTSGWQLFHESPCV